MIPCPKCKCDVKPETVIVNGEAWLEFPKVCPNCNENMYEIPDDYDMPGF